jgi:hypothetical protein
MPPSRDAASEVVHSHGNNEDKLARIMRAAHEMAEGMTARRPNGPEAPEVPYGGHHSSAP